MSESTPSRWRLLWIVPPILIGIAFLMWRASGREAPAEVEHGELARTVRVVTVEALPVVPEAEGYGPVQPDHVWSALAQVAGRITALHPRLQNGEIIAAGEELYQIDPEDYQLKLAQAQAELAELKAAEQSARASLKLEQSNLKVAERELKRLQGLAKRGVASKSDRDAAERAVISARAARQNAQSVVDLVPSQRAVLQAKLTQAERDLQHTRVVAPFNLRIANQAVELAQYFGVGQKLFEGDSVDRVEIVAQVPMTALRRLFIGRELNLADGAIMDEAFARNLQLRPVLRLDLGGAIAEWQAEFVRFTDSVDTDTRTMGVVLAVDKPFEKIIPGRRPPLSKGMFVQVLLRAPVSQQRLVVPRSAVRNGSVMVVDADQRLQMQPVGILYEQGPLSVIQSGLQAGQRVVVSDLSPAIAGMLLNPEADTALAEQLRRAAGGDQ